ncbi:MAG: hypothetical protein O2779_03740 [Nanoarchaeota archaeon]|nr:hypothetical protein [Nanoarchaeota archaeon]
MNIFELVDKKIPTLRWYDFSLLKLSTAACILWIAKLWPPLLSMSATTYLIIGIVAALPLMKKMFFTK